MCLPPSNLLDRSFLSMSAPARALHHCGRQAGRSKMTDAAVLQCSTQCATTVVHEHVFISAAVLYSWQRFWQFPSLVTMPKVQQQAKMQSAGLLTTMQSLVLQRHKTPALPPDQQEHCSKGQSARFSTQAGHTPRTPHKWHVSILPFCSNICCKASISSGIHGILVLNNQLPYAWSSCHACQSCWLLDTLISFLFLEVFSILHRMTNTIRPVKHRPPLCNLVLR